MKITIQHYEIATSVSVPDDINLIEIINSFRGMMSICGWSEESWQEEIIELGKYYEAQNK